jgi:hypothetical protein
VFDYSKRLGALRVTLAALGGCAALTPPARRGVVRYRRRLEKCRVKSAGPDDWFCFIYQPLGRHCNARRPRESIRFERLAQTETALAKTLP